MGHTQLRPQNFLIIEPTRCTNSSIFIFGMKIYMFQTVPLSIIRSFPLYTQQWYMSYRFADSLRTGSGSILILLASCQKTCITYTIAVCTMKNSLWWTEQLSETCTVSFKNKFWGISASSWFYYKKFITVHGHMNLKCPRTYFLYLGKNKAYCTISVLFPHKMPYIP